MQRMTGRLWMIFFFFFFFFFTNDLTNFNVFNVVCYTIRLVRCPQLVEGTFPLSYSFLTR